MLFDYRVTLLLASVPFGKAFRLTFYSGFDCNGQRLGSSQASLGGTCQDPGALGSSTTSVLVVREDNDGDDDTVVFYPRDAACNPSEAISTTNVGCVNTIPTLGGFNVISGEFNRRDADDKSFAGAKKPRSDSLGITHGDFFESGGELYRWQMIAKDTFTGVRPDQWDDSVHIASTAPLQFSRDYPFNFTEYDLHHGMESEIPEATANELELLRGTSSNPAKEVKEALAKADICRQIRNCGYSIAILSDYYFPAQTELFVNAVRAAAPAGQRIWNFLNQQYIAGVVTGSVTGYIAGQYFGAPPNCPTTGNDEAVMRSTINDNIPSSTRYNALNNDIISGVGPTSTLATLVLPASERGDGRCNTPVGDPSPTLKLSRHKRALYASVPGFDQWLKSRDSSI